MIDAIALGECKAIMDGLKNPDMVNNPNFLRTVRQFLKDNNLKTVEKQVIQVQQEIIKELPEFPHDWKNDDDDDIYIKPDFINDIMEKDRYM